MPTKKNKNPSKEQSNKSDSNVHMEEANNADDDGDDDDYYENDDGYDSEDSESRNASQQN